MPEFSFVQKIFFITFALADVHYKALMDTHPVFLFWGPIAAILILAWEKLDNWE